MAIMKMNKILLINPPWNIFFNQEGSYAPLGLCCIAAVLEKKGYNTKIFNCDLTSDNFRLTSLKTMNDSKDSFADCVDKEKHPIWQEIRKCLKEESPDIIGISVLTSKHTIALKIAVIAKSINPNMKIIFGGVHPSILPDEALKEVVVDYVVRGEGEETILELLNALENDAEIDGIKGVSFRKNGAIVHNEDRDLVKCLDDLGFPARHLIMNSEEMAPIHFGRIFATRGCPYSCIFCSAHKIWTRKVRYRTPENVVDEMILMKAKHGTRLFIFDDDSFTINRKYIEKLCGLLKEKCSNIFWRCETRADLVDDKIIKTMKKAGCVSISVGAESGNNEILKKIKKGVTVEQIKKAVSIIKQNGIMVNVFFMLGFPWETEREINDTLALMKDLRPDGEVGAVYSLVTPYYGTELYKECEDMKVLPSNKKWDSYYHQNAEIHLCKGINKDRYTDLVVEAGKIFDEYNRFNRIKMLLKPRFLLLSIQQRKYFSVNKLILLVKYLFKKK